jgi:hypothetical protein
LCSRQEQIRENKRENSGGNFWIFQTREKTGRAREYNYESVGLVRLLHGPPKIHNE